MHYIEFAFQHETGFCVCFFFEATNHIHFQNDLFKFNLSLTFHSSNALTVFENHRQLTRFRFAIQKEINTFYYLMNKLCAF